MNDINIYKLKEYVEFNTNVIKNYKQLCDILGTKYKTGKSKILHLEKLKKYCHYERKGDAFIILGFNKRIPEFKETVSENLKLLETPGLYSNTYSKYLMYKELTKEKYFDGKMTYQGYFSKNYLYNIFQYSNYWYTKFSNKPNELAEHFGIPKQWIYDFFDKVNSSNRDMIKTAIKHIKESGLFNVKENILVGIPLKADNLTTTITKNKYGDLYAEYDYGASLKDKKILKPIDGLVYEQCIAEAIKILTSRYPDLDLSTEGKCKKYKGLEYWTEVDKLTAKHLSVVKIHPEYKITMLLSQEKQFEDIFDIEEWENNDMYQNLYRRDYLLYKFQENRYKENFLKAGWLMNPETEQSYSFEDLQLAEAEMSSRMQELILRLISCDILDIRDNAKIFNNWALTGIKCPELIAI